MGAGLPYLSAGPETKNQPTGVAMMICEITKTKLSSSMKSYTGRLYDLTCCACCSQDATSTHGYLCENCFSGFPNIQFKIFNLSLLRFTIP